MVAAGQVLHTAAAQWGEDGRGRLGLIWVAQWSRGSFERVVEAGSGGRGEEGASRRGEKP
jgi:hypothetical protein